MVARYFPILMHILGCSTCFDHFFRKFNIQNFLENYVKEYGTIEILKFNFYKVKIHLNFDILSHKIFKFNNALHISAVSRSQENIQNKNLQKCLCLEINANSHNSLH